MKTRNKKRKYLSINLQYIDQIDLKQALEKVGELVSLGTNSFQEKSDGLAFEFDLSFIMGGDSPYQERIIDGKRCLVIESKINEL